MCIRRIKTWPIGSEPLILAREKSMSESNFAYYAKHGTFSRFYIRHYILQTYNYVYIVYDRSADKTSKSRYSISIQTCVRKEEKKLRAFIMYTL